MYPSILPYLLLVPLSDLAFAFCPQAPREQLAQGSASRCRVSPVVVGATRRSFVEKSFATVAGSVALVTSAVQEATASGGATAGGVYLLSVRGTNSLGFDQLSRIDDSLDWPMLLKA